jgi:predicted DNA-binding mobile mystery protein A
MNDEFLKLGRQQLDRKLKSWQVLRKQPIPAGGWLRAIRTSLGIPRLALAKSLKVAPGTVDDLEYSEASGTASLNSLRKAAAAMNCDLVYAIVPRTSLSAILKERATEKARAMLGRVGHTMKLEAQEIEHRKIRQQAQALVQALINKPRSLWK